jgi:GNAT superfamily N-acetyltransferase
MHGNATIHWRNGSIHPALLEKTAELFVVVDKDFGDEPWWRDVRAEGLAGAAENLDQRWRGYVTATAPSGELIGFGAMAEPVEGSVELSRVMVHPDWRRQGIGAALLRALVDAAITEGLQPWVDVLETSKGAIDLYTQVGFETVSYQYGRDSGRLARQMRYKVIQLHPHR